MLSNETHIETKDVDRLSNEITLWNTQVVKWDRTGCQMRSSPVGIDPCGVKWDRALWNTLCGTRTGLFSPGCGPQNRMTRSGLPLHYSELKSLLTECETLWRKDGALFLMRTSGSHDAVREWWPSHVSGCTSRLTTCKHLWFPYGALLICGPQNEMQRIWLPSQLSGGRSHLTRCNERDRYGALLWRFGENFGLFRYADLRIKWSGHDGLDICQSIGLFWQNTGLFRLNIGLFWSSLEKKCGACLVCGPQNPMKRAQWP